MVLGVSTDDVKAQAKFRKKQSLPFNLLADTDHAVHDAYGVWGPKKFMGKEFMGTLRTTFVIGPDGVVQHVFENVSPKGHGDQVLGVL